MSAHPPDLAEARAFLELLDPDAEEFTFQTFVDRDLGHRGNFAHVRHGSLDQLAPHLALLQTRGAGVFVTVNETDLKGRKAANVVRVRAVFVDLDGAPLQPVMACKLEPHVIVESSPGRYHAYWLVDGLPLDQFREVQKAIAARFGGDKAVCDLPRVMRLPGFWHQKGEPFRSKVVGLSDRPPCTAGQALADLRPAGARPSRSGKDEPHEDLRELVRQVLASESYHEPLARLAWRYLSGGMAEPKVVETLQGLMQAAAGPRDERWQARHDDIPRAVETAAAKQGCLTSWEIILAWIVEKYEPRFVAKDGRVFSGELGRLIKRDEVDEDPDIIDRLAKAVDRPLLKGGNVNRNRLSVHFRTWLRSAWGQLKLDLPDHKAHLATTSAEVVAEHKRNLARLLNTLVDMRVDGGVYEKRSLGNWADHHAKKAEGHWRQVGSWKIWGKVEGGELLIALWPEAAHQLSRPIPEIGDLDQGDLTALTRACGMHEPDDNRITVGGEQFRATVLSAEFVAEVGAAAGDHYDARAEEVARAQRVVEVYRRYPHVVKK